MNAPGAVAGMFGRIARFYDLLNRVLSLGADQSWRRALAAAATPGEGRVVADLAAGTLDVSLALRRLHGDILILALDFCLPMLRLGQKKLRRSDNDGKGGILPVAADALRLPLVANSVDGITMAFGIRNIPDRGAAFAEMLRVLRPGGRAGILEFASGRERVWGGLYNFYLQRILPRIGKTLSHDRGAYRYLAESIRAFPAAAVLEKEMRQAGFARTAFRKLTSGIVCLHTGEKPLR